MEEISLRTITFVEALYYDRGDCLAKVHSSYLPYLICQTAILQYRLWKKRNDLAGKQYIDSILAILTKFTKRWEATSELMRAIQDRYLTFDPVSFVPGQYLDIIVNLSGDWPPLAVPL